MRLFAYAQACWEFPRRPEGKHILLYHHTYLSPPKRHAFKQTAAMLPSFYVCHRGSRPVNLLRKACPVFRVMVGTRLPLYDEQGSLWDVGCVDQTTHANLPTDHPPPLLQFMLHNSSVILVKKRTHDGGWSSYFRLPNEFCCCCSIYFFYSYTALCSSFFFCSFPRVPPPPGLCPTPNKIN